MESRFGQDFGQVRVHSGVRAAQSARALRAEAFTVGNHVVFGADRYAPGTRWGRRLLAHELTHVVQQWTGPVRTRAIDAGGALERAAERAAVRIDRGGAVSVTAGVTVPRLQRNGTLRFGAGRQLVEVSGETVRVNGEAVPATLGPDGTIRYNGREIVMDGDGVFRYRDNQRVVRRCNPYYYDASGRTREGRTIPSVAASGPYEGRSPRFYDTQARTWQSWSPGTTATVRRPGTPIDAPSPDVDPELARRMSEVNRIRTEFEERVRIARERGGHTEEEARRIVRERMQNRGQDLPGRGEFEAGQTYVTSPGSSEEGAITTAARQDQAERPVSRVPSSDLEAHVARINDELNVNFRVNRQSLNHGEVRQLVRDPSRTTFYPDRTMCDSCQRLFVLESRRRGADLFVIDPDGFTRTFTPDGRIVEFHEGVVYERRTAMTVDAEGFTRVEIRNDPSVIHRARPGRSGTPGGGSEGPTRGGGDTGRGVSRTRVPESAGTPTSDTSGRTRGSTRTTGAGRTRGLLRGIGRGVGMGAVGLLVDIADLIFTFVVQPRIDRLIAQLQEQQRARLRRQIEERLEHYAPIVESQLDRLEPLINERWEAGRSAFVRLSFKAVFEDERDRSIFDREPSVPTDPFDLSFYRLEDLDIRVVDSPVTVSSTTMEPAMEYTLTSFDQQQRRAWHFFTGRGGPLVEQTITTGFELSPPEVEPVRRTTDPATLDESATAIVDRYLYIVHETNRRPEVTEEIVFLAGEMRELAQSVVDFDDPDAARAFEEALLNDGRIDRGQLRQILSLITLDGSTTE